MPPKINGSSLADLVKQAVQREVAPQLNELQELLQEALARIKSLEKEIVECKATPRAPRLPSTPSSSTSVCRHWLRKRCTWKDQCRFSHGGEASDADSEGSYSAVINAKDLDEEEMLTKVAEVTSSSSSCEVKLNSSEVVVECLINSNLPGGDFCAAGVLQPEPVGGIAVTAGALARTGFDSDVKPHGVLHCTMVEDLVCDIVHKAVDAVEMHKEKEWLDQMSANVDTIQARFLARYSPQKEGDADIIHSAQVAIPRIDFSKVKPHLHKKLPQPVSIAVQGCYSDPASQSQETCSKCLWRLGDRNGNSSEYNKYCKCGFPFGTLPGFNTSVGVVAVPKDPIGGYVYAGGTGDKTTWRLHADEIFI